MIGKIYKTENEAWEEEMEMLKELDELEELDELDTLEGHYGTDGFPYSEDELNDWIKQQ